MKKCILVLGMHRSGTSAITGVLGIMGMGLGDEMMAPLDENPKGYFENVTAYKINEKMLQSVSSSWDDVFFRKDMDKQWNAFLKFQDDIVRMITGEFGHDEVFGVKDPRLCNLLPVWLGALTKLDIDTTCILVLRHPIEVAESLKARDGFSIPKGILLWMMYMFNAEAYSRSLRRLVVCYNDVLQDVKKFTDQVSSQLNVNLPNVYANTSQEINQFLNRDLKHHNIKKNIHDKRFFKMADNLYHLLLKLRPQQDNIDEVVRSIDALKSELEEAAQFFYNDDVQSLSVLEDLIRKKDRQIHSQEWIISQDKIWAEKLKRKIQTAENAKAELTEKIKQREAHIQKVQLMQTEDRKRFEDEIDRLNASINTLNYELNLIKGSKVWRIAELFRRLVYSQR